MADPLDVLLAQLGQAFVELQERFPQTWERAQRAVSRVREDGLAAVVEDDWMAWLVSWERGGDRELAAILNAVQKWVIGALEGGDAEVMAVLQRVEALVQQAIDIAFRPPSATDGQNTRLDEIVMPLFERLSRAYIDEVLNTRSEESE